MLSNVVDNAVVKKNLYDEWVKRLMQLIQTNKILTKRLKMLIKRYLIPKNLSRLKNSID